MVFAFLELDSEQVGRCPFISVSFGLCSCIKLESLGNVGLGKSLGGLLKRKLHLPFLGPFTITSCYIWKKKKDKYYFGQNIQ